MNVLKSVVPLCLSAAMIVQFTPSYTVHGEAFAEDPLETEVGDLTFRYIPDLPRQGECTLTSASDNSDDNTISITACCYDGVVHMLTPFQTVIY